MFVFAAQTFEALAGMMGGGGGGGASGAPKESLQDLEVQIQSQGALVTVGKIKKLLQEAKAKDDFEQCIVHRDNAKKLMELKGDLDRARTDEEKSRAIGKITKFSNSLGIEKSGERDF